MRTTIDELKRRIEGGRCSVKYRTHPITGESLNEMHCYLTDTPTLQRVAALARKHEREGGKYQAEGIFDEAGNRIGDQLTFDVRDNAHTYEKYSLPIEWYYPDDRLDGKAVFIYDGRKLRGPE
jgi:hypothetical protein